MSKQHVNEKFGRSMDTRVRLDVSLPLTLRSRMFSLDRPKLYWIQILSRFPEDVLTGNLADGLCQMVIDTVPASQMTITATWKTIWYLAKSATAKCVRDGKGGSITIPGNDPTGKGSNLLRLTIMDKPAPVFLPGQVNNGTGSETEAGATA